MKKTLVAIAALAAATGAMAQSSVELYGIADIGYNTVTSKSSTGAIKQVGIGAGGDSSNGAGNLNGGRIGFRGTEDLGNGLKAGFLIEYGVNFTGPGSDNGTKIQTDNAGVSAASSENAQGATIARLRQGGVNLSSSTAGKVTLGTQYAYHDATSGAIAGSSASGGTNNVVGAANLLKYGYTGGQPRLANAISYESPVFSGVQLKAMRNQGKAVQDSAYTASPADAMNANSYAIDYTNGPVKAGFAQTKYSDINAAASTGLAGNPGLTTLVDVLGQRNDQTGANTGRTVETFNVTNRVMGGQYNAGFARFGLNRGTYESLAKATAANGIKSTQTMGTVAYPMGKTTLIAGYTTGTIAQGGTDVYKTKAFDLIAVYDLSKRTNLYALAVQTKYNSQVASVTATQNDSVQQRQYGVGVRHSF